MAAAPSPWFLFFESKFLVPAYAYLNPEEVYQLCLTSKYWHRQVGDKVLATALLGVALRVGIAALLKRRGIDSIGALFQGFSGDEFVIAGSIILQAIHGEEWESDIDCYITEPFTRVIEQARRNINGQGYRFGGVLSASSFFASMEVKRYYHAGYSSQCLPTHAEDDPEETPDPDDFFGTFGADPDEDEYPKRQRNSLDLVVGRSDSWTSPLDMIDKFDMEMCKSNFNGTIFRIPYAHLTFNRMTHTIPVEMMTPNRKQRMAKYEARGFELHPDKLNPALDEDTKQKIAFVASMKTVD
jgi:hypothetical protein